MNTHVKMAVIIALRMIVAAGLYLYFSPFHSCVREVGSTVACARFLGGR